MPGVGQQPPEMGLQLAVGSKPAPFKMAHQAVLFQVKQVDLRPLAKLSRQAGPGGLGFLSFTQHLVYDASATGKRR